MSLMLRRNVVKILRSRMDRAKVELKEQTEAFEDFSAQQAERVPEWKEKVFAFEADNTKKSPYDISHKGKPTFFWDLCTSD
jgi:Tfp pilus assembly protein PilE